MTALFSLEWKMFSMPNSKQPEHWDEILRDALPAPKSPRSRKLNSSDTCGAKSANEACEESLAAGATVIGGKGCG